MSYDATISDANVGLPLRTYSHTVPANPVYDRCTTTGYTAAAYAEPAVVYHRSQYPLAYYNEAAPPYYPRRVWRPHIIQERPGVRAEAAAIDQVGVVVHAEIFHGVGGTA